MQKCKRRHSHKLLMNVKFSKEEGIHLASDSKAFTFDLEESLYFEKGQEVAELRGIALEPEISIQPYEEYISIRGNIELQGEYEKVETGQAERSLDFEDFQAKRYVEKVIDEEGLAAFSHRFPVEISVPPYRVTDLNEVTVHVDSFDYEMPEPSHLKLYATIEIHGINSEAEQPRQEMKGVEPEETKETEMDAAVEDLSNSEVDTFEFELRKSQEDELTVTDLTEPELDAGPIDEQKATEKEEIEAEEREQSSVSAEYIEEIKEIESIEKADSIVEVRSEEAEQEHEEEDPDRWKKKSQTLAEFFNQLSEEETESSDAESQEVEELDAEDDVVASDVSEAESYEERVPEDASLLSDIFREAKEEQFTKMRLCIVQNQDTIETIAARFSVSPLQLIKQNELEDDFEVREGQLLYIPVNK